MNGQSSPEADGKLVDARVGTILADRYRIDALVGEGGMGRVYAAEHVLMRKKLAVKILHSELTRVPELVARFEREAMAAAHIEHPNVAAATDFGKLPDGSVFLVLEFVQGKSLRDEIAKGPLGVERALQIARQIAAGLGNAHALEIVHRDLKPENVMLVEKGQNPDFVKILDFGIAKVPVGDAPSGAQPKSGRGSMPSLTKTGMVFGTPEYMAPEQALGQPVDGRADLYALGVILFEMLAGVRPFSSQSSVGILGQQLSKPPPKFAERAQGILIPPSVEQIVHRLLRRDASERYQRAEEVTEAIDVLLAPTPGRGPFLFTIPDGSPSSVSGAPSSPSLDAIDIGAEPPIPSRAGSLADASSQLLRAQVSAVQSGAKSAFSKTRDSLGSLAQNLKVRTRDTWPHLLVWAERTRGRLPKSLADKLRNFPTKTLLLSGVAVAFLLLFLTALMLALGLRASDGPTPVASVAPSAIASSERVALPAPTTAPVEDEVQVAAKQGPGALEALALKQPKNVRILLTLASVHAERKDLSRAVGVIARALTLDASLANDKELRKILLEAAQSPKSSASSFALLEGAMGSRGADVIYELAISQSSKPWVKARAEKWLASDTFQRVSSPALNAAVALRFASSCPQYHALLLRVRNVGDERSLPYLDILKSTKGCGKDQGEDCYPCLRADNRLEQAFNAAKNRKAPE